MIEKTVKTILRDQWSVKEHETCGTFIERLRKSEGIQIVPVVDSDNKPVGMLESNSALQAMSNPLHYSVCERRSLRMLMQEDFVQVDEHDSISTVSTRLINTGQSMGSGGFIITRNDQYIGIGLNSDLLYFLVESNEQKAKELAAINSEMLDSVRYASRIQHGMLPNDAKLRSTMRSTGLIWEPRDIVGGDVYWFHSSDDGKRLYYSLIDCTGHGVPGSLMSMLVITSFNRVFSQTPDISPSNALAQVGDLVRKALQQDRIDCESNDGFDAGLLMIDKENDCLIFAGARTNGYIIPKSNEPIVRLVADKEVLGYPGTSPHTLVEEFKIDLHDCGTFIMASDGIFDQPGDPLNRAFGPKRFVEALEKNRNLDAQALMMKLTQVVTTWRGNQVRRDDLSAIALSF